MPEQTPIPIRLDSELQAIVPKYLANREKDCASLREQAASGAFADAKPVLAVCIPEVERGGSVSALTQAGAVCAVFV